MSNYLMEFSVKFILGVLAVGQLLYGINIFNIAESAIHEVLAAVMLGSGSISLGLAFVIHKLDIAIQ